MALFGEDRTSQVSEGSLCTSCATLALNGTVQTNGSMTTPVAGTNLIPLNLPLAAANALDVWNPAATSRTSAAVRAMLTDSRSSISHVSTIRQFRAGIDGSLFDLPGGAAKVAVGGELQNWVPNMTVVRPLDLGPASLRIDLSAISRSIVRSSRFTASFWSRLFRRTWTHLSTGSTSAHRAGTIDYSDFGGTFNPKFAANVEIVQGIKLRANWARCSRRRRCARSAISSVPTATRPCR